jgi:exonuclease SbcD
LRFLQFSDVHLDAGLRESKLSLPEEKRARRQREIKETVAKACSLARERECDLMLIPGDLFDDESAEFDTIRFLVDTFGDAAPMPIFITPGNHDPYLPQSPYNPDFLAEKSIPSWAENVHVFEGNVAESVRLPGRHDVVVTGIGYTGPGTEQNRILAGKLPVEEGALNLLLFHGSLEPFPPGKQPTMPFSRGELLSQGFDYAAIGHYHSYLEIRDEGGRIRGAYSGTPASQRLNEAGEKVVLLGEFAEDKSLSLERLTVDRRRLHVVEVACSGLGHSQAVIRRIEEEARKASHSNEDILFIRLQGRFPHGTRLNLPEDLLADRYFHAAVDASGLLPDYDLDKYLQEPDLMRSVEGEFVKTLLNREAEARDDEEKRLTRAALYYGLDAITEGKVCGRYED